MHYLKIISSPFKILQVAYRLLTGVDNLLNTNNDATYQSQDTGR